MMGSARRGFALGSSMETNHPASCVPGRALSRKRAIRDLHTYRSERGLNTGGEGPGSFALTRDDRGRKVDGLCPARLRARVFHGDQPPRLLRSRTRAFSKARDPGSSHLSVGARRSTLAGKAPVHSRLRAMTGDARLMGSSQRGFALGSSMETNHPSSSVPGRALSRKRASGIFTRIGRNAPLNTGGEGPGSFALTRDDRGRKVDGLCPARLRARVFHGDQPPLL